jgi:hypothetical protein
LFLALQDTYINIREEVPENGRDGSYHFALSGKSFHVISQYFSSLLPKVSFNGSNDISVQIMSMSLIYSMTPKELQYWTWIKQKQKETKQNKS